MPRSASRPARVVLLALILALTGVLPPGPAPAVARAPGPLPDRGGVWPLSPVPEVLVRFDPPSHPWDAGHRGVDLAGTTGQSVRASLAGIVRYAGRIAGRGVVVVEHGETRTTYEPVAASVRLGSRVVVGAVIGALERLGGHCLPRVCLHWGLLRGDAYLDPLSLVGGGPVRLLPLQGTASADAGVPPPRSPPSPGAPGAPSATGAPALTEIWHRATAALGLAFLLLRLGRVGRSAPSARRRSPPGRPQARGWAWR